MNTASLEALNTSLLAHQKILSGLSSKVSISVEKEELETQKEIIQFFKDGEIHLNFYNAEKPTEQSFVHVCLVKGMLEMNIGMCYLPALRKSSRRAKRGMAGLFEMLIKDVMAPKLSQTLNRDNKSMLLYALSLFPNEESYKLINGRSHNKGHVIPDRFDSVEKVLEEMALEKYTQFKVA